MPPSRRMFLQMGSSGTLISALGFDLTPAYAQSRELKIARTTETRSTCPYCSVSCGVIIHTLGDKAKNATPQVVHVEGDPDHPINRGTLCPKGSSLEQAILNERRIIKPQVRRPGGTDWEDISWDQALMEIAQKVKKTRDDTFVETDARPGGRAPGKPGSRLTRPHGLKFGTNIRTGRNDQRLGRYQEYRHDA